MAEHTDIDPAALGPNMWLIDEMYRRYREDPDTVDDRWKEFFEDFTPKLQAGGDGLAAPPSVGVPEVAAEPAVPIAERPETRPETVNLGLAVDVKREDGSRSLFVPNIKAANEMDFAGFWAAYEEVIRKVRTNKLTPDDFAGTTVTLSNPGTIGTQLSVPRLMKGQGLIVATGRIDYPTEYQGADPAALAELGVGKVFGVTSTYDHRVIQGAESGLF